MYKVTDQAYVAWGLYNIYATSFVYIHISCHYNKDICIVFYCIALHCIVLHCIILHCIALYCIVLHCIVLYCIVIKCID